LYVVYRRLLRLAHAARPPEPVSTQPVHIDPRRPTHAVLAAGPDAHAVLSQATLRALAGTVAGHAVVVPATGTRPTAMAEILQRSVSPTALTLVLPPGTAPAAQRRWRELSTCVAGAAGWTRIDLTGLSTHLPHLLLPSELARTTQLVILTAEPHSTPATVWRRIVHPHSALRALPLGHIGEGELSLAREATYVHLSSLAGLSLAVVTSDRIAALLLVEGLRRIGENHAGIEAEGPWEAAAVQHLTSLDAGIRLGSDLVLHASVPDNDARTSITRLAEVLGARVVWERGSSIR
jgi:hypothetical protein